MDTFIVYETNGNSFHFVDQDIPIDRSNLNELRLYR